MKRIYGLLAGVLLLPTLASPVNAGIVEVVPIDFGNGTIASNCGGFDCTLTKDYTAIGPMGLFFDVNQPGDYMIQEDIGNNTGIDWTDFHWELSEEFGNVTITDVTPIAPFTNINPLPDTLAWLDGGVLPDGGVFVTTVTLNVADSDGGLFFLNQFPTTAPEPTTLALLGFGLAGVGFSRRKKRH